MSTRYSPFQADVTRSWRENVEARRLLAECAANPPATREFRYAFGERETRYTGPAARDLGRIYRLHGEAIVDGPGFKAWALDSVDEAIADAIAAARMGVAA